MKKYNIFIVICFATLLHSCFDDGNNFNYQTPEVITVTGLNASYDKISQSDSLNFKPTVRSTDPKADFEYFWGIYETNVQGYPPKLDTISKSLTIKYRIIQPAKAWILEFAAKNKHTGYTKIITSTINVGTQFTRGWYVLKDNGNQSDLDLFLTPTTIVPTSSIENVYSLVNGEKLEGKGLGMNFESTYKSMVTGTNANTRAMFIFTEKDASIINTNTVKEIRPFNTCFYISPTVKAPNFMIVGSSSDYFVNNGILYSIYTMSSNFGVFGNAQMRDAINSPYRLSKYYLTHTNNNPVFFDETSSSFVSASGSSNMLNPITDATGTAMSANKNNKTLLYLGPKGITTFEGVAVLQDKTNPALKILSVITPSTTAFKMVNDTLLNTSKLYNAVNYSANVGDESMLYFVVGGNQVWSRNLVNKFEQLQFTAPAGETISFIRHRKSTETGYAFNYVMIGTTTGSGTYNVRMFTKTAGNLATTPSVTLTGSGNVTDVFYLSPSTSYGTYPNAY